MERQALYLNRCRNLQIIFKETYYSMPLPNDKNTSALQQLTFLDDLVASERRNISDVIFRRIRDAIISGELPPGYVFPNENELCKKLNIGRSSLREAYSPLETLKLISRSKAGTYVNDLDIYQNAMNFEAIAKQTDVKNIAEYRQIFEIGAIQLAAKRATEKNVTRLRESLKKMEEVPEDSVALSQYDFEFHAYLMKMTHNELLIVMFNSIRNAYKNLTESIFAMGCLPTTINEHLAIVDAIADHDSALAAHMMQLHLSNIESFRNRQSAAAGKASEK